MTELETYAEGLKRIYALESDRDVSGLVHMLNSPVELSPNRTLRAAAAAALGRIGDPAAGTGLIAAVGDPSPEVRYAVIRALGLVGYQSAGPELVEALNDQSLNVRRVAAVSLGLVRFEEARSELHQALEASDPWTRLYAAEALAEIGDPALAEKIPGVARRESRLALARRKRWRSLEQSASSEGGS